MKYLVIVESPSKAKTIQKYLGKNYTVEASMGHIRDLPKSKMGIDFENNFEPKYLTIRGKTDLIKKLKKEIKNSDKVYLAPYNGARYSGKACDTCRIQRDYKGRR